MITKSFVDENTYKYATLENGLKVLLVHNNTLDKSSCSIAIRTGSMDDTIPGIAHFLEHMLFMGTERYKGENDFMEFLNMHNGSTNAHTDNKITTYYFDICSHHFDDALDRFCEFFVSPLFINDAVERELNAVDSEFKNGLMNDSQRVWRLKNALSNDSYNRFSCGNKETLAVPNIREKVINFWKENYSSDEMCLTIYHNENIMDNIRKKFKRIPQITKQKKTLSENVNLFSRHLFNESYLNRIISVNSISDIKELKIYIEVPKERFVYKDNTYGYLSFLLAKESKGSLIHHLSNKGYAFDIDIDLHNDLQYSVFIITLGLTDLGSKEIYKVIGTIKMYLRSIDVNEDEYLKLKKAKNRLFRYLEQENPMDFVVGLSEKMHYYPIEHLLNHGFIYEKFNEEEIQRTLSILQDSSNWLVMVLQKHENINDYKKEKYYGIEYKIEHETLNEPQSQMEHAMEKGKLLMLFENRYKVPESFATIRLNANITLENYLLHALYIKMCEYKFIEMYDDFLNFNGICYHSKIITSGFEIMFSGFNEKLIEAVELFFAIFFDEKYDTFEQAKENLKHDLSKEIYESPYKLLIRNFARNIHSNIPDASLLIDKLKKIKYPDINVQHAYFVDMFVCGSGNFYAYKDLLGKITSRISLNPVVKKLQILEDKKISFSTEDKLNNACGLVFYTGKKKNTNTVALTEMIIQIGNEMFFDELRTKEAFGYIVYNSKILISDDIYVVYIVQSERDNRNIEVRMKKFCADLQETIDNMEDEEFEMHKESVISRYEESFKNLDEFSSFFKELYYSNSFDIDYQENVINAVSDMEKKNIKIPAKSYVIYANKKS